MAREVRSFDVTIPAGILKTAPQITDLAFGAREVREIEIIIPPGPRGAVGFQLGAAGRQMFPTEPGAFFVSNNEIIHWEVEEQITSGAWQLIAYNSGQYPHTLEIRFLVDLPTPAPLTASPLLPASLLSSR